MLWIAPSERDTGTETLESRLMDGGRSAPRQLWPDIRPVFAAGWDESRTGLFGNRDDAHAAAFRAAHGDRAEVWPHVDAL